MRILLRKAIIALTVSALILSKRLDIWLVPKNRFFYFWESEDAWARILLILVVACGFVVFDRLIWYSMGPKHRRIARALLMAGIMFVLGDQYLTPVLLTLLHFPPGWGWLFFWTPLTVMYLGVGLLAYKVREIPGWVARIFLMISPIIVFVSCEFLVAEKWGGPHETFGDLGAYAKITAANKGPIILIVFDEWSAQRSFLKDDMIRSAVGEWNSEGIGYLRMNASVFIPEFAHLNALCGNATVFTQERSAGSTTASLPAILFERLGKLKINSRGVFWQMNGVDCATKDILSVFDRAKSEGWKTALLGFYYPYHHMLGKEIDLCHSYPYTYKPPTLIGRIRLSVIRWILEFKYPLIADLCAQMRRIEDDAFYRNWYNLAHGMTDELISWMRVAKNGQFYYIHLPIPHPPPVFTPDGDFRRPKAGGSWQGSPDEYKMSLSHQDKVIGEVVKALKDAGVYDSCTLVMTGDHTWRQDPVRDEANYSEWVKHVPLIIKSPNQKRGVVVTSEFDFLKMMRIINGALRGQKSEDVILRQVGMPSYSINEPEVDEKDQDRD